MLPLYKLNKDSHELIQNEQGDLLKREDLHEQLKVAAENTRDFIIDKIKERRIYKLLDGETSERILLQLNDFAEDSYELHFYKCKLEGVDPFERNLSKCIELLWDCYFSVEEYKSIGDNDGRADLIAYLLEAIGYPEEALQVREVIY